MSYDALAGGGGKARLAGLETSPHVVVTMHEGEAPSDPIALAAARRSWSEDTSGAQVKRSKTEADQRLWRSKLVLVMVGLPARGKSYISKKIGLYANWHGYKARTFNVGNERRVAAKGQQQTADFFDASNTEAKSTREQLAYSTLDSLLDWLRTEGDIAIFDATNTTRDRRARVVARCKQESEYVNVIFVESICTDPEVLHSNFMQKIAMSPDYRNMSLEEASADLAKRIANYEKVYEPVDDDAVSYMKLINLQSKIICNRIFGPVAHRISSYLMCLNIVKRKIFLCRAGKSEGRDDVNHLVKSNKVGGRTSSDGEHYMGVDEMLCQRIPSLETVLPPADMKFWHLSEEGKVFAAKLRAFVLQNVPDPSRLVSYSSTLPRAMETVQDMPGEVQHWSALNALDTGTLQGKSLYEIDSEMPGELNNFAKDPYHYRLPGGESFADLVHRLDPFVTELERQTNSVLVVSHLTTLQALFGYFMGSPINRFSNISIPQNVVIQLEPNQYGWTETVFKLE